MKRKSSGFTLIELLVVIVIIGIMATYAMPQFAKTKARALEKEAQANLKLIAAAEKIYRIEQVNYFPANAAEDDIADINGALKLSLTEANWDYLIVGVSGGLGSWFTARAQLKSNRRCYWNINQSTDEPYLGSAAVCP